MMVSACVFADAGPSGYAYADCGRDWAVYVMVALKEEQRSLIQGIYDVTGSPQRTVVQEIQTCRHMHSVATYIAFLETNCMIQMQAKQPMPQQRLCFIYSITSISDKMTYYGVS